MKHLFSLKQKQKQQNDTLYTDACEFSSKKRNVSSTSPKAPFFASKSSFSAVCCTFAILLLTTASGCHVPNKGDTPNTNSSGADSSFTDSDMTEQTAAFDAFTEQIFFTEIAENTINLHFTLAHPENYGITNSTITLGDISMNAYQDSSARIENYLSALNRFEKDALPRNKQLTYDVLKEDFEHSMESASYLLYDEILEPSGGIHAQLPILLEEYVFYDEEDVSDYLTLLSTVQDYFAQVIAFEKEKAAAGLFMADYSCESVISQCQDFIAAADNHFLITTFNKRIEELEGLTQEKRDAYIAQNETLVKQDLAAAYKYLAAEMTALLGSGQNEQGLCYLPDGRDYYEYLVYSYTGSDKEVYEIQKMIDNARKNALLTCAKLSESDPDIFDKCETAALTEKNAAATLEELKLDMLDLFPAAPNTSYTVNYIDECIANYVAPAYYITPPVDDYSKNSIHINADTDAASLSYFTTLAHEGFPGHLYQTIMSYEADIDLVRNLLYFGGYTEGWATYVEMISYSYADIDPNAAIFLQNNQSALLSLYASTDLGIHYDGWTREETAAFWKDYGISDAASIDWIYEYIVGEPGNYLKYYVGYLEFLELKEYAMKTFQNDYNDISFHQALLEIGPAPFYIIEEYLDDYYIP